MTIFKSGHKTFDKQTNIITTGNVIANTQISGYVRPKSETECNGFIVDPGTLQAFDLKQYTFSNLPTKRFCAVRFSKIAAKLADDNNGCIAYKFLHKKGKYAIPHGLIITTIDHKFLWKYIEPRSAKSALVINEAQKYITK